MIKRRTRCHEAKTLDDFHRSRAGRDGRRPICRPCAAEYRVVMRMPETELTRRAAEQCDPARGTHVTPHRGCILR